MIEWFAHYMSDKFLTRNAGMSFRMHFGLTCGTQKGISDKKMSSERIRLHRVMEFQNTSHALLLLSLILLPLSQTVSIPASQQTSRDSEPGCSRAKADSSDASNHQSGKTQTQVQSQLLESEEQNDPSTYTNAGECD